MTMRINPEAPKQEYTRNKFDIARSNETRKKAFEKNLRDNPTPPPAKASEGPRSKGGILETATVTEARLAMVAAKAESKDDAGRLARFNGIAADASTVQAIVDSWVRSTPTFLVTRHNTLSFGNAITTYVYRSGMISIPILNDIFQHLLSENYLETSRGGRIRGSNGIMVSGATRMYPALVTAEDKQEKVVNAAQSAVGDRAAEDKANRELSLSELAQRARANYRPNPRDLRVI